MRTLTGGLLVSLVLTPAWVGCQGDPVAAPDVGDSSVSDSSVGDSGALDASEGGVDANDGSVDAREAAVGDCVAPPVNLVPNGDFSGGLSGWSPSDVSTEFSTGPCGQALHVLTTGAYGGINYQVKHTFPVDTKLRLRGWFKSATAPTGVTPAVFATLYHPGDAGEASDSEVWTAVTLETGWKLSEATLVTKHEETSFTFVVASRRTTGGDDFYVAGLALYVE